MVLEDIKGINASWISETDLTNLNSGEGESNYIDVKKYKKDDIEYPYVSGQAMRYYLKEAIRRNLSNEEYMCVPNEDGETCGEIEKCLLCDLFGFMTTRAAEEGRKGGAVTRVSPVKVAPAIGLMPFEENSNIDFLTRKHRKKEAEKLEGDIVNVEVGNNIYKSGISLDLVKVGAKEKVEEAREVHIEEVVDKQKKIDRIKKLLNSLKVISDYSKQARLLTDFTPDFLIITMQNTYNHRLQKAIKLEKDKTLNKKRLKEILDEVSTYSEQIFVGMIEGIIKNEDEIKNLLEKRGIEVDTPANAIEKVIKKITK
ncbi:MAG: type I-B CRISPR-associated protein Cas7/Cst2/DevR [Candidatus Thermoplasmatota archaeon]